MFPGPVRPRRLLPRLAALLLLLCVPLVGCDSGSVSGARPVGAVEREVRRAVAQWAATPPEALAAIPLEGWSYEVSAVREEGVRAFARAELRYRLTGYDAAPAGSAREVELAREDGTWAVVADRPAPGAPPQLWDQG